MGPGLTGVPFMNGWSGVTVGDLFERIRMSMPKDSPGKLTLKENADVTAYVLSMNKFPAGEKELEEEMGSLKRVRIESRRKGKQPN